MLINIILLSNTIQKNVGGLLVPAL